MMMNDDDGISGLPDDILVDILSLLSLDEAVGTSVLSSRWINLWEHTNCLNLDGDSALPKISTSEYVRWVDRILQSHKAPTLKEFRIKFPFRLDDINAIESITRWLEFAFVRHVERLELDLSNDEVWYRYCLTEELLAAPSMPLDFKCLRALLFTRVNVTDTAIGFFLHNCPLLEQLVVNCSHKLSNLEVCGSSLVLKHLEIAICSGLKSLKVSAPSLTYFKIVGLIDWELVLENAHMLVETHIRCRLEDIQLIFSTLSSHASQLEILHLDVWGCKDKDNTVKLPELAKLKKMSIEHVVSDPECFLGLADLIRASPCLEELVLENGWYKCFCPWGNERVEDAIKSPHQHLKVVEYFGYCGSGPDIQFVSYILENCVSLEKLIVSIPESESDSGRPHSRAKQQLEALVPRHVELVCSYLHYI